VEVRVIASLIKVYMVYNSLPYIVSSPAKPKALSGYTIENWGNSTVEIAAGTNKGEPSASYHSFEENTWSFIAAATPTNLFYHIRYPLFCGRPFWRCLALSRPSQGSQLAKTFSPRVAYARVILNLWKSEGRNILAWWRGSTLYMGRRLCYNLTAISGTKQPTLHSIVQW